MGNQFIEKEPKIHRLMSICITVLILLNHQYINLKIMLIIIFWIMLFMRKAKKACEQIIFIIAFEIFVTLQIIDPIITAKTIEYSYIDVVLITMVYFTMIGVFTLKLNSMYIYNALNCKLRQFQLYILHQSFIVEIYNQGIRLTLAQEIIYISATIQNNTTCSLRRLIIWFANMKSIPRSMS